MINKRILMVIPMILLVFLTISCGSPQRAIESTIESFDQGDPNTELVTPEITPEVVQPTTPTELVTPESFLEVVQPTSSIEEEIWVEIFTDLVVVKLKNRNDFTYIIPKERVIKIVVGTQELNEAKILGDTTTDTQ